MEPQRKYRRRRDHDDQRVPTSPDKQLRKLLHSQKEKARHRRVMAQLNRLFQMVPLDDEVSSSKTAKFRQTISYFRYLERIIQAECLERMLPIPARCDLFTDINSQQQGLNFAENTWEELTEPELESAVKLLDDTAVVPDLDLLATDGPQDDISKGEIYGVSQEDWMAAGPSQETSQRPVEVVQTSYIDVICDPALSIPLQDAPEVFVVSADGTVTSVGEQLLLHCS